MSEPKQNGVINNSYTIHHKPKRLARIGEALSITEKACLREDKDMLKEALMDSTFLIWDGKTAAFNIFGRVECNGIITTIDRVADGKDNAKKQQRFHKLLRFGYGIKEGDAFEIEEWVRSHNTLFNPITTLRDGKNFIFWENGRPNIDMYCDGMFNYIPKHFVKYGEISFTEYHRAMMRYLMRMSGVILPDHDLPSPNVEGLEELRKLPEFHVFEHDMKTDAAKLAQPHKAMHVIRTLVGDSGVGKTKRAHLMTQLFGRFAHTGGIIGEKQFHDDDHPYVVKLIDEATRMKVYQQKRLEQQVTLPEIRINRKYMDVVTWNNPTFHWITANQLNDPDDFTIVGPNQRWLIRQPVGNAIDFKNDVGWAINDDGRWSMHGLNTYMDICRCFYDEAFWPIPSVESSKTYSNKVAYDRHMTNDNNNDDKLGMLMYTVRHELTNNFKGSHLEILKAEYDGTTFTAGNFRRVLKMTCTTQSLTKFLSRFNVNTGLVFMHRNNNVKNFQVTDWDLFKKTINAPLDEHMGEVA